MVCEACSLHRYIRDKNVRSILERAERLQAVKSTIEYLKNTLGSDHALVMRVVESTRDTSLYDEYVVDVHQHEFLENFEGWCRQSTETVALKNLEVGSMDCPRGYPLILSKRLINEQANVFISCLITWT